MEAWNQLGVGEETILSVAPSIWRKMQALLNWAGAGTAAALDAAYRSQRPQQGNVQFQKEKLLKTEGHRENEEALWMSKLEQRLSPGAWKLFKTLKKKKKHRGGDLVQGPPTFLSLGVPLEF